MKGKIMSRFEVVARFFTDVLTNPDFKLLSSKLYPNRWGITGIRWTGQLNKRLFYISESRTSTASLPHQLARIISTPESLDRTKEPLYCAYRRLGEGIRIEAWHCGRWFQIFTPIHRDNLIALSLN